MSFSFGFGFSRFPSVPFSPSSTDHFSNAAFFADSCSPSREQSLYSYSGSPVEPIQFFARRTFFMFFPCLTAYILALQSSPIFLQIFLGQPRVMFFLTYVRFPISFFFLMLFCHFPSAVYYISTYTSIIIALILFHTGSRLSDSESCKVVHLKASE